MLIDKNQYINALLYKLIDQDLEASSLLVKALSLVGRSDKDDEIQPLQSILSKIGSGVNEHYYSFNDLELSEEGVFAKEGSNETLDVSVVKGIKERISQFITSWKGSEDTLKDSLYPLLHRLGARIATSKNQDASLFDQNRLLAAITCCLEKTEGKPQFILYKGAVSGIQSYIYSNIKAEQIGEADNSSKRLRGRSFMVAFINQVIAESIVEKIGLEQSNVLFVGGGQFTLLLPNTEKSKGQLDEITKSININLIKKVGMQLSVVGASKECGKSLCKDFAEYYSEVSIELDHAKYQKHNKYLGEVFQLFEYNEEQDTFINHAQANKDKEEIRLGTLVPYANYILEVKALSDDDKRALNELIKHIGEHPTFHKKENYSPAVRSLAFLGKHYYIIKGNANNTEDNSSTALLSFLEALKDYLKSAPLSLKIIALNDADVESLVRKFNTLGLDISYAFRFTGNHTPIYPDDFNTGEYHKDATAGAVMLFEDLAAMDEHGSIGSKYQQLGVMRLDVDDLGAIFAAGLNPNSSAERLLCLSREFQLFFGGYFNTIARRHNMYVTYSGGDDAFVVGSWLNAINFAYSLNQAFRKFTCNNPEVNFSAGIFICNPHYPVPRFAKDAEVLEKEAKSYEKYNHEIKYKNAICLFNHTLNWVDFEAMIQKTKYLTQFLPEDGNSKKGDYIRRSMLRRILRLIQTSKFDLFERYRNIAAFHGLIARQGYGEKKLDQVKPSTYPEFIKELVQLVSQKDEASQQELDHYTIPFHILLYNTKMN
jgi:CRISPR-associated protein Csm1